MEDGVELSARQYGTCNCTTYILVRTIDEPMEDGVELSARQYGTCNCTTYILVRTIDEPNTARSTTLFLPLPISALMTKPTGRRSATRRRNGKDKDEREWTTPQQKMHLQSRQVEYGMARDKKQLTGWFTVELATYFERFPTQEPTDEEIFKHGTQWTIREKRSLEEQVNGQMNNTNNDNLPLTS
jgi:hypothetical protein